MNKRQANFWLYVLYGAIIALIGTVSYCVQHYDDDYVLPVVNERITRFEIVNDTVFLGTLKSGTIHVGWSETGKYYIKDLDSTKIKLK